MLLHHGYGIDIGTSTVKIYDQKSDRIQKERNMIAILNNESVYAIGNEAYHLLGKTPENMEVITPVANGRISDVSLMEAVLHTLLERCDSRIGQAPALYFSVLPDMTEIEKRAYHTIAHRGNLSRSRIYMVERPIADALSFGIPVDRTNGTMIVNIGAQSTEISVITDARVVISHLRRPQAESFYDQCEDGKAAEAFADRSVGGKNGGEKGLRNRHEERPSETGNCDDAYGDVRGAHTGSADRG
jgi:rod shape-determining protein MreB